jgi:hypothetical protein
MFGAQEKYRAEQRKTKKASCVIHEVKEKKKRKEKISE